MTEPERIEALLDLVDDSRTGQADHASQLVVLGLAERQGKRLLRPTTAGWNVLGEHGRPFRTEYL